MKKSLLILSSLFLVSCTNNKSSFSSSLFQNNSIVSSYISSSLDENSDKPSDSVEHEKFYEIYGRIINTENIGIGDVKIKLTSNEYEKEVLTSNSGGYHFTSLPKGTYTISIILEDNYVMESSSELLYINLSGTNYFYQNSDIILRKENINWGELS